MFCKLTFEKPVFFRAASFVVSAYFCLLLGGCGSTSMFGGVSANNEISAQSRQEKLNADAKNLQAEFASSDKFFDRGDLAEAKAGYERVLKRFPANIKASEGLKKIELARSHERLYEEAEVLVKANDLEAAKAKINLIILENPSDEKARKKLVQLDTSASTESLKRLLSAAFRKPISIDFVLQFNCQ
jgi:general secretion pathway protein D